MRRIVLLGLIVIGTASCQKKKDWECTCTISNVGSPSYTDSYIIMNETKTAANKQCVDNGKAQVYNGTYSCKLK